MFQNKKTESVVSKEPIFQIDVYSLSIKEYRQKMLSSFNSQMKIERTLRGGRIDDAYIGGFFGSQPSEIVELYGRKFWRYDISQTTVYIGLNEKERVQMIGNVAQAIILQNDSSGQFQSYVSIPIPSNIKIKKPEAEAIERVLENYPTYLKINFEDYGSIEIYTEKLDSQLMPKILKSLFDSEERVRKVLFEEAFEGI